MIDFMITITSYTYIYIYKFYRALYGACVATRTHLYTVYIARQVPKLGTKIRNSTHLPDDRYTHT